MQKRFNQKTVFIGGAILTGLLVALGFEFAVNFIFRQPQFFFSLDRFIAVAMVISSAICLVKYRRYFCANLHQAFLLIALTFGAALILVFPRIVYVSPDDHIHFRNAYFFMEQTAELRGGFGAIESSGFANMRDKGFDEMAAVYDEMNRANEEIINAQYQIDGTPQLYARVVYLPFYLGLKLANFLHLKFTMGVVIAKIFNLVCYAVFVYFAIKQSGKFSKIFFVVGLLTCNIFLATQFSYDPLVIAGLLLAISLFLHIRQTEKGSPQYLLGFVLVATLSCLTKAIYCPILLLALMIPNAKFDCKKRAVAFKVCAMLVMVVLASTFVLPMLGGGLASDIRGGNTSVSRQIGFLLGDPIRAVAIALLFICGQLPSLIFDPAGSLVSLGVGATAAPIYSICGPAIPMVGTLSLIVLLWATFNTNLVDTTITKTSKIGLLIIYTILVGGVAASMYLSFTPVGSRYVDGVQPRYFAPILPLLLIVLVPLRRAQDKNRDYATLFIPALCLALIFGMYVLQMSRV